MRIADQIRAARAHVRPAFAGRIAGCAVGLLHDSILYVALSTCQGVVANFFTYRLECVTLWTMAGKRKNPAAMALGKKGGKARAKKLTAAQLSEQGRNAVQARWAKQKKAETK